MNTRVIDFYDGAAMALGYRNFAELEESVIADELAEIERTQKACAHPYLYPESGVCCACGKGLT